MSEILLLAMVPSLHFWKAIGRGRSDFDKTGEKPQVGVGVVDLTKGLLPFLLISNTGLAQGHPECNPFNGLAEVPAATR